MFGFPMFVPFYSPTRITTTFHLLFFVRGVGKSFSVTLLIPSVPMCSIAKTMMDLVELLDHLYHAPRLRPGCGRT